MARRRWTRLLWVLLCLLVGAPGAYLLAAFGLARVPVNRHFAEPPPGEGVEIQLVSNGIHVDFLLPVATRARDWSETFPRSTFTGVGGTVRGGVGDSGAVEGTPGITDVSSWKYVLVGWGDRGFYLETPTWADLKLSTALRAVFWPSATVVHVQYVRWPFEEGDSCRSVRVSEQAYGKLCAFIEESLRRDREGQIQLIAGRGYGPTDNFYEGTGSYHAFNTCNSWTVRGLKRTGVRTALWSPFAGGVLRHLP
jgi:uncharacterized protein (TIGR02117 family)